MFRNPNKHECPINMIIHSIEADVVQSLTLSLKINTGSKADESEKFEINGTQR